MGNHIKGVLLNEKRTTKDLLGQLELSPTTVNKWSINISQLSIGMFTKKQKP